MEYLSVLSEAIVFKRLSDKELNDVLASAVYQLRRFSKGDLVAQAGSPCEHVRIVVDGKLGGEMMDLSGKVLKIEDLLPSMMIAPAFVFGKKRQYPVNVIAMEDSIIWQIHRDDFTALLQKNLLMLDNFMNAISSRAQFLTEKIKFVSFPSIRAKLAGFILHYAQGRDELQLPITHQQLSELFGVTRPSLSREIRNLNTEKIIESERDVIKILDKEALLTLLNE